MKAPVYDINGKKLREEELPEEVFGVAPNVGVMHQALVRQEANARLGTHKTLTRGEVSRTTAMCYRQKGTGRARHGSRAAPIFVGGGVAHGPRPHSYNLKMPRKMRRLALRSALSAKAAVSAVALVEGLSLDVPKTKTIRGLVETLSMGGGTLFVLSGRNENVERSIRNLPNARYLGLGQLNVRDLMRHQLLLIDTDALGSLVGHLGSPVREDARA